MAVLGAYSGRRIGPRPRPVARLSGRAALLTGHEMASEDHSQTTISHRMPGARDPTAPTPPWQLAWSVVGSVEACDVVASRGQIPSAAIADRIAYVTHPIRGLNPNGIGNNYATRARGSLYRAGGPGRHAQHAADRREHARTRRLACR